MTARTFIDPSPMRLARIAGLLYLVIIVCGLFAELAVRSTLIVFDDPATTAENINGSIGLFRLGIASDVIMVVADIALAVVLYRLLLPVSAMLSLSAMAFRLIQASVLGANLLNLVAVDLMNSGGVTIQDSARLGLLLLDTHRYGYDVGLIFFGISCVFLGALLLRSGYVPRALGVLILAAAGVYLVGSFIRLLAPGLSDAFQPFYGIAALAEIALCLWLLIKGVKTSPDEG